MMRLECIGHRVDTCMYIIVIGQNQAQIQNSYYNPSAFANKTIHSPLAYFLIFPSLFLYLLLLLLFNIHASH